MKSFARNLILFVFLILGIICLHSYRFQSVEYRQDEINTVHASVVLDTEGIVDWLSYEGTHPLGWRLFAVSWIDAVGIEPEVARFQSTLFTILALAFIFRLGKDLFDTQTGMWAVLFVGLLPYAQWHFHELRPYAPLIMFSAAMQIIYWRWLLNPTWKLSAAYVVLGGLGLQVHYFVGFIVIAHVLYLLIACEWQREKVMHLVGLGFLILLSFSWWLPSIYYGTFVVRDNGINYGSGSTEESIATFLYDLNLAPLVLIPILFLKSDKIFGPTATPQGLNPRWADWRRTFTLLIPLGIFFSAASVNNLVQLLTFRNLSVVLPMLGIAFGFIIRSLSNKARWGVGIAYVLVACNTFIYYAPQVPHSQMTAFMNQALSEDDKFIVNIAAKGATAPAAVHYFRDHLDGQPVIERFYAVNELDNDRVGFKYNIDPFLEEYDATSLTFEVEDLDVFEAFIADTDRLYFIVFHWDDEKASHYTLRPMYEAILLRDFEVARRQTWPVVDHNPPADFTIIEYVRR